MATFAAFDVSGQIFFRSRLSLGLVNLKPIVPGHVLVIPQRVVPRLGDLRADEVADLFQSVQTIGRVIEREHRATSLTVACQDGPAAGQSVPHVHIHILPRSMGDYEPVDAIYDELDAYTATSEAKAKPAPLKMDNDARKPRSHDEMVKEADALAVFFR